MALEKQYGKYQLTCVYCGESREFDSFDEAIEFLKCEGWNSIKINGEWVHECWGKQL